MAIQSLPQPSGDIYFLKGVCLDADRDIGSFHDKPPFVAGSVSPISPCNRTPADADDSHFHVNSVAVSKPSAKLALHTDRGKRQVFLVVDVRIIDPQFRGEKLLHGKMKIVEKTGVVHNAGMVNVGETNLDGCPKSHDRSPPSMLELDQRAITERIFLIHRVVKIRELTSKILLQVQ
jgi:hypothetical protein